MRCNELEGKLVEYLDGRARPAERRAAEAHLAGCDSCRVRAEEFRALWSTLDDLPAITPSPAFDASLRARIAAAPAHRGFWAWLPSPRLAFALVALIAVSAYISSIPQGSLKQPAPVASVVTESDFRMINDLPELENYDVLSKFDALSELPVPMDTAEPQTVTGKANE
jgi:anti-sigma factor RsiW